MSIFVFFESAGVLFYGAFSLWVSLTYTGIAETSLLGFLLQQISFTE